MQGVEGAHLSESQKAHLTGEFVVVTKMVVVHWFYACDCGQGVRQ